MNTGAHPYQIHLVEETGDGVLALDFSAPFLSFTPEAAGFHLSNGGGLGSEAGKTFPVSPRNLEPVAAHAAPRLPVPRDVARTATLPLEDLAFDATISASSAAHSTASYPSEGGEE